MPRIGLKLWSTNLNYIPPAQILFAREVFDYIELFVVPGSLGTLTRWQALDIPYVLHAPHSTAGLNPADSSRRQEHIGLVGEVNAYALSLSPEKIIFHPGINGDWQESISQFKVWRKEFPCMFDAVVIENKPRIGLKGEHCLGASVTEMSEILKAAGCGFCLDFGHAICTAVADGLDWKAVVRDFMTLKPVMYHLCDGPLSSKDAHEHFGRGAFDLDFLVSCIEPGRMVTLETKKDFDVSLDDFAEDVEAFKRYASH